MLCANAPRKTMSIIHILVSMVLVVVCLVLAFTPLTQIRITDKTKDSVRSVFTFLEQMIEASSGESSEPKADPEKVDAMVDSLKLNDSAIGISVLTMRNAFDFGTDASNAAMALSEAIEAKDTSEMEKAIGLLKAALFESDGVTVRAEAREGIILVAALLAPILDSVDLTQLMGGSEDGSDGDSEKLDWGGILSQALPEIIAVIFSILLAFLIPLIYVIIALVALISALKGIRDPIEAAPRVGRRLPKSIVHPMAIMLITGVSATVEYTTNTLLLLIFAAIGTFVNVLFSRLHSWERRDIAYANAVQGITLLSIGAFAFFFINLMSVGAFANFLGNLSAYLLSAGTSDATTGLSAEATTDIGLILIAVFFALGSLRYFSRVLRRESLVCTPKRKGGARACHLVRAIFMLVVTLLPMMAITSTANNGGSFLTLSAAQETALNNALIATGAIIVIEIILLILRKIFGKNLDRDTIGDILSGVSMGPTKRLAPVAQAAPRAATPDDALFSDEAIREEASETEDLTPPDESLLSSEKPSEKGE